MVHIGINWQPYPYWRHKKLTPLMRDWLLDPKSMTRKLELNCSTVSIDLIRQEWSLLNSDEAKKLGLSEFGPTMVREVQIICDEQVWICAGTFISKKSLPALFGNSFKNLGTRPLGELLFKNRSWRRTQLDLAPIKCASYQFEFLNTPFRNCVPFLWGRRSYFEKNDKQLMLIEIFTQRMWDCLACE